MLAVASLGLWVVLELEPRFPLMSLFALADLAAVVGLFWGLSGQEDGLPGIEGMHFADFCQNGRFALGSLLAVLRRTKRSNFLDYFADDFLPQSLDNTV